MRRQKWEQSVERQIDFFKIRFVDITKKTRIILALSFKMTSCKKKKRKKKEQKRRGKKQRKLISNSICFCFWIVYSHTVCYI